MEKLRCSRTESYIDDSISDKLDIARKTQGTSRSLQEETSIVSTDLSKTSTSTMRSETDENYKLVINGNDETKKEININNK